MHYMYTPFIKIHCQKSSIQISIHFLTWFSRIKGEFGAHENKKLVASLDLYVQTWHLDIIILGSSSLQMALHRLSSAGPLEIGKKASSALVLHLDLYIHMASIFVNHMAGLACVYKSMDINFEARDKNYT